MDPMRARIATATIDAARVRPAHGDLRHYEPGRRRALDLLRFMEDDRYLMRRKQAFIAHVERKVLGQHYVAAEAPLLWMHWLKDGLLRYLRAHPRVDGSYFTKRFLRALAQEVAVREHTRVVRGDYADLTVAGSVSNGRARVARW